MAFHFQLDAVLRIRKLVEEQARLRLDQSAMRLRRMEQSLTRAEEWSRQSVRARSSIKRLPGAEVSFSGMVMQQTRQAMEDCRKQIEAEEKRSAELREAYLTARMERRTLGTLRENALRSYEAEETRREQDELDESFLGKMARLRNNGTRSLSDH